MAGDDNGHWNYIPSVPAGAIATLAFAGLTLFHIFRFCKTRTWFCLPFIIGGIFEIVGYGARVACKYNLDATTPYIIQALLILLAPIIFAASVYMILSRLILATAAEKYAIVRASWLTKIFVGGDIFCFLVQALGAGILSGANSSSSRNMGQSIILGGLILQIVVFGFFLLVAVIYHKRLRAQPTDKSMAMAIPWERFIVMLYIVSVLITIRNLFRVIEYAMGEDGYLLQKEWPIYVFDALLMAIVLCICQSWYVGRMDFPSPNIDLESVRGEHRGKHRHHRHHRHNNSEQPLSP